MREYIQNKLDEIESVDSGDIVQEDIIELGTTYFGYSITTNFQKQDQDKNGTYRVSMIGFVIRKQSQLENTLSIVDNAVTEIEKKFKELNIKCSHEDITINNNVRKIKITGYCYFNEINNKIVI